MNGETLLIDEPELDKGAENIYDKNPVSFGVDSILNGLERFGFNNLSLKERIDYFKTLDFDKFIKFIIHLRKSYGLNIESKQDGFEKNKKRLTQKEGYIGFFHIGPDNPYNKVQEIFNQVQANINYENYKDQQTILYFAIIISQLFDDGNGRTALLIYHYFTGEKLDFEKFRVFDEKKGETQFFSEHKILVFNTVLEGITKVYKDAGLIKLEDTLCMSNGKGSEGCLSVEMYAFGKRIIGNDAYIKFLALFTILQENRQKKLALNERFDLSNLTKQELTLCNELYRGLKNSMFELYLNMITQAPSKYSLKVEEIMKGIGE